MRSHRTRFNVLLAVFAVLLLFVLQERIAVSPPGDVIDAMIAGASDDRQTISERVQSQATRVEEMHDSGRALMAERTRMRAKLLHTRIDADHTFAVRGGEAEVSLIRYDDRLISELQHEIERTRRLNAEYLDLTLAYERELLLHRQIAASCRKRQRRRRLAGIVAGTAVAAVAVVAVLKD